MTEHVVNIQDYKGMKPKSETHRYQGHVYELVFDMNAGPDERWQWIVRFTRVYTYTGASRNLHLAAAAARRQIRRLSGV